MQFFLGQWYHFPHGGLIFPKLLFTGKKRLTKTVYVIVFTAHLKKAVLRMSIRHDALAGIYLDKTRPFRS